MPHLFLIERPGALLGLDEMHDFGDRAIEFGRDHASTDDRVVERARERLVLDDRNVVLAPRSRGSSARRDRRPWRAPSARRLRSARSASRPRSASGLTTTIVAFGTAVSMSPARAIEAQRPQPRLHHAVAFGLLDLLLDLVAAHALVAPPVDARPGEVGAGERRARQEIAAESTSTQSDNSARGKSARRRQTSRRSAASRCESEHAADRPAPTAPSFSALLANSVQPRGPNMRENPADRRSREKSGAMRFGTRCAARSARSSRRRRRPSAGRRSARRMRRGDRRDGAEASTSRRRWSRAASPRDRRGNARARRRAPASRAARSRRSIDNKIATSEARKRDLARDRRVAALEQRRRAASLSALRSCRRRSRRPSLAPSKVRPLPCRRGSDGSSDLASLRHRQHDLDHLLARLGDVGGGASYGAASSPSTRRRERAAIAESADSRNSASVPRSASTTRSVAQLVEQQSRGRAAKVAADRGTRTASAITMRASCGRVATSAFITSRRRAGSSPLMMSAMRARACRQPRGARGEQRRRPQTASSMTR